MSYVYCPEARFNRGGPLLWACWERNSHYDLHDWVLVAADFDVEDEDLVMLDGDDYPVQSWEDRYERRDAALYSLGYFTVVDCWVPDAVEPGRWYTPVVMMYWRSEQC